MLKYLVPQWVKKTSEAQAEQKDFRVTF